MNFKIATSFLLAASLLHQACFANKLSITMKSMRKLSGTRGGMQNQQGGGGQHGGGSNGHQGGGSNGHQGGDRPFSGGPDLDCPGFPGDRFEPETTTVACDAAYDCELRGNGEARSFVCRTMFHPITGEKNTKAICIPNHKAWTTDECGCCGEEDCPEQPDFIDELDCEEEPDQDIELSRAGIPGGGDADLAVVCREVTNPFTGEDMSVTLPVPKHRGLEGDICGCCDGVCPERGEQNFLRPDLVNITYDAGDLITCDLPRKRGQDNTRQGLFVCRELFNPRTGVSEQESLCIPGDRAWETDACGCCGGDCPTQPAPVDIECTDAADATCELRNGEDGVFVCRALFHPVDGEIRKRSMCIPSDHTWVTDACGCCEESGCPTTPEGGFDNEDTQLMTLALETGVLEDSSGASSVAVLVGCCSLSFVALMALVI